MKYKAKGYLIAQSTIEAIIVFAVIAAIAPILTAYSKNGSNEAAKLQCFSANVTAAERIKKTFSETGLKTDIESFSMTNGGFETTVTELNEIKIGSGMPVFNDNGEQIYSGELTYDDSLKSVNESSVIYRAVISTKHYGFNRGADLIVYFAK